jgi:tripartite ATP-independent transporter DctM subunit
LFIYLGLLLEATGMARAMVRFIASLVGHVRGGLEYVLIAAMYLVSGISGAKAADMAAVAPVLFPEMRQAGRHPGDMVGLLNASGAMAETIPPSIVLITIGSVTGVSIAALFRGGLLPAAVAALCLAVLARWRAAARDKKSTAANVVKKATWSEVGAAFLTALPALVLPFLIRYAVLEGVATATEVSTIGVVYTLIVALFMRRVVAWDRMGPILVETASLTGAILFIIGTANAMGWALTQSGFSHDLADFIRTMALGPAGFLAISIIVFIVLGSFLEGIPAVVLFGPLLFPIALAVGIDEVHYAMVAILSMGLGLFTPPFGLGFYMSCAIGKVSPDVAMARAWPYLGAVAVALILVAVSPWLSAGFPW